MFIYTYPNAAISSGTYSTAYNAETLKRSCQRGQPYTPEVFKRHHQLCPYDHLIVCEQMHGTHGVIITHHNDPYRYAPYRQQGDYIISTHRNIACAIATADCAPIIIHDPHTPIIAAIHAGWRGLAHGITHIAINAMRHISHSDPTQWQAFIGPCARSCCYVVDETVMSSFTHMPIPYVIKHNSYYLDIRACAYTALTQTGLVSHHITALDVCTICNVHMCSYRRNQTQYRHITYGVIT